MPDSTIEQTDGRAEAGRHGEPSATSVNLSLVLVVGNSGINRVVVSRIVERTGLRAVSVPVEEAEAALVEHAPGAVVLDGGATNAECDRLFANLTNRRMISEKLPVVIFLSTTNLKPDALPHAHAVDAVVAKPITPESLQPVIRRLTDGPRATGRN